MILELVSILLINSLKTRMFLGRHFLAVHFICYPLFCQSTEPQPKLIKRERNLSSYRVQMRIDCQKSQGWSLKPSEMEGRARLKIQEGSVSRSNFAGQWPSAMPLSFKQSFSWLTWLQHFLQGIWPFSAFKLEPPYFPKCWIRASHLNIAFGSEFSMATCFLPFGAMLKPSNA